MTTSKPSQREAIQSQLDTIADPQVFDPNQDVQEKRWLRREYRQLIQKTEEGRAELLESDAAGLVESVQSANQLYNKVKNTYEATLDARLLILSADIGAQKAKKMRIEHDAFDVDAFFGKIQGIVAGSRELPGYERINSDDIGDTYWSRLGALASNYTLRAPTADFMFGPLLTERKVVQHNNRRQNRNARNAEDLVKPQQLHEEDIEKQENETTQNVRTIFEILERVGPINLFEFIVNPDSFSQTVENFFYLSFLIRDGKAFIDDESGQPMIETCMPPTHEDYSHGLVKKQLVMELDLLTWKELIKVYDVRKAVIPTRSQTINNGTGKWYG